MNKLYVNSGINKYDIIDLDDRVDVWGTLQGLVYLAGLVMFAAVALGIGLTF